MKINIDFLLGIWLILIVLNTFGYFNTNTHDKIIKIGLFEDEYIKVIQYTKEEYDAQQNGIKDKEAK